METFGLFCIILVLGSLVSRFPIIAVNKTEELESQITGAGGGGCNGLPGIGELRGRHWEEGSQQDWIRTMYKMWQSFACCLQG